MTLTWQAGLRTFENLRREARRLRETSDKTNLSLGEVDAFSKSLWEISWAIGHAQPGPNGHDFSLSDECLGLFRQAADMAERERKANHPLGNYLPPLTAGPDGESGEIIPFQADKK